MTKRTNREIYALYLLSVSLIFLGFSNLTKATAGTTTDAHVKVIEKYLKNLDSCLYEHAGTVRSYYEPVPLSDIPQCKAAIGNLIIKWW